MTNKTTIFELIEISYSGKEPQYPSFTVYQFRIGFFSNLVSAEKAMKLYIEAHQKDVYRPQPLFGFSITEYALDQYSYDFLSPDDTHCQTEIRRSYLPDGKLWAEATDDEFLGRCADQLRFAKGDLVEVLCDDTVTLEIVEKVPLSPEQVREVRESEKDSDFISVINEFYKTLPLVGHYSTPGVVNVFPPRFPVSEELRNKLNEKLVDFSVDNRIYVLEKSDDDEEKCFSWEEMHLDNRRLRDVLKDVENVTKLTVSGTMTDEDFRFLKGNYKETLQELDLSKATVEFEDYYFWGTFAALHTIIVPAATKPKHKDFSLFREALNSEALTTLTALPDNPLYASEDGILFNKKKTRLIRYPKKRQGDYEIPKTVKKIDDSAFEGCAGLTSIKIPKSVKKIGLEAFAKCTGLTSVSIPDGVIEIGSDAFAGCTALKSVYIPASVKEMGKTPYADFSKSFDNPAITVHPDNPHYESEDGVLFIKGKTSLISYPADRQGNYKVPDTVFKVYDGAFNDCAGLTSLYLPKNVGEFMMRNSFKGCSNLASFSVHPDNPCYSTDNGVLLSKDRTRLFCCPEGRQGDYIIPDTVVEIWYSGFRNCTRLTSITIHASLKETDDDKFEGCTASFIVHPDNPFYASENRKLIGTNIPSSALIKKSKP